MFRLSRTSAAAGALVGLAAMLAAGCGPAPSSAPAPPPPAASPSGGGPPAPSLSGHIPLAVPGLDELPPDATPEDARPFFDTFSWQEFVALNWPAAAAPRGTAKDPDDPQTFLGAAGGGQPVVWGTYKADFELFDQGDARPTAWNDPAIPVDPCGSGSATTKTFVRVTKGDSLVEIGNQAFSYPLIDQHLNYAVYEIRFNKEQYDFMRGADDDPSSWLYLVANLAALEQSPGGVQMPASDPPSTQGAIMLKAAWKVLEGEDDPSRFYAVDSQIYDPQTKKCAPATVGLVGFHIAQKLKAFPEWIWSTFEQVDNVPAGDPEPGHTYSFNNGTNEPATVGGYADRPPEKAPHLQPVSERKAVQVTRFNPIPESTKILNESWQAAMGDTVWRYYELVITQWPSDPGTFLTMEKGGIYPQDSGGAFPVNEATNTVMETYFQSQNDAAGAGGNSCMSCHYRAGQADYSWTLMRGAH